jgi:hypothetical protein
MRLSQGHELSFPLGPGPFVSSIKSVQDIRCHTFLALVWLHDQRGASSRARGLAAWLHPRFLIRE